MWNYRVCTIDENTVGIFEVYYDDNGTIRGQTQEPVAPTAPSVEGLREDLERMLAALEKPVLPLDAYWPSFTP